MQTTTERPVWAVVSVGGQGPRSTTRTTASRTPVAGGRTATAVATLQERPGSDVLPPVAAPARDLDLSPATPTRGVRVLLVAFCCRRPRRSCRSWSGPTGRRDLRLDRRAVRGAGFLGSAYAAGFRAQRARGALRDWRVVRVPFLTILVFVWLTAGATFFHLHRLHVQAPGDGPLAEVAAWLWIAVYVVVPMAMTVLLPRQPLVASRVRGRAPVAPLPRPLTAVLVAQGVVLAGRRSRCWSAACRPTGCRRTTAGTGTRQQGMAQAAWRRPRSRCGRGPSRPSRPASSRRGCSPSRSPSVSAWPTAT